MQINRWFALRLIVVAASGSDGLWGKPLHFNPSDMDWWMCWIIFATVTVGSFAYLVISYRTRELGTSWVKPSWFQNPLQIRSQPLQFLHLVAATTAADGLGGVLSHLPSGRRDQMPELCLPMLIGLGIWISMRIWIIVFLRDDVSTNSRRDAGYDSK